jgi:RNA polymerase sigma-70 factor (ECF subfamily)
MVERELLTRFANGDSNAVRAVYQEYGKLVYAVAFKMLSDRGLAEEATQQAFLQAWRSSARFDVTRELGPWLATIARRAAIDIHRREARRVHDSIDDANPTDPALVTLPVSAERVYDVWEIRRAIDALPPEEAALVRLQHLDGFSHTEIAEQLGIPVGTVKSRMFRAHRRLAGQLGHLRGDPDEPTIAEERTDWIEEKPR